VRCGRAGNDPSEQDRKFEKGEVMEQELHDEINAAVQLAERKPKLIDALLLERREIDGKLAALGRAAYMESSASDTLYNARQYLQDRARYERNMLHCECGQATTPEQLERAKRFGVKADPRGHVHSFHGVSA
jgi:hypothetical protein